MYTINNLYQETAGKLDSLDFDKLWEGFRRYDFALYDSKSVWLRDKIIPWDDRFIGNTAILFEDRHMAIWNAEDCLLSGESRDTDILTANLVHEMFHAFQNDNGETRFPQDLKTLTYTYDISNFNINSLKIKYWRTHMIPGK